MELQFESSACRCLDAAARDIRTAELTQEVRLGDAQPDIGRVLTSWGQVILRAKEWQTGLVTVTGGIMTWILYAPEDGTQPRCVDTWIPFQLRWDIADEKREGPIRIHPLLRFVDSRGISARKMMVRAGVAAMGEALSPVSIEVFRPCELPQDIEILQNTYPVRLPKEAGEKTFLLDEDLTLPAGTPPMERLLAYTVHPQTQDLRVSGDKVIMRCSGRLHLIYRCPEGRIRTIDLEIPISQYAQLEETYGNDAQAEVAMGVTSLEVDQLEGDRLRLKCGLVAQYLISDRFLAELTEDAYSTIREVALHTEQLHLPAMQEKRMESVPVRQQMQGISADVADVCFLPDFPRQSRAGDKVMLDLTGQFQILYYASDDSLQSASSRWEGAMQILADPETEMVFSVQPQGTVQVLSGAEELNLSSQYGVQMCASVPYEMPMITELDIGAERERDPARPSLILCRSDGESLWEMAKRCGSTVGAIRRANGLTGEAQDNRMLLVPLN